MAAWLRLGDCFLVSGFFFNKEVSARMMDDRSLLLRGAETWLAERKSESVGSEFPSPTSTETSAVTQRTRNYPCQDRSDVPIWSHRVLTESQASMSSLRAAISRCRTTFNATIVVRGGSKRL